MGSPENSLLILLKKGDHNAFKEIFYQFNAKLERFAKGYLPDTADASDIVQNVFVVLWKKKETLSDKTNLSSYLFTLTRNQCLDHLKHKKVRYRYIQFRQTELEEDVKLNIIALERLDMEKDATEELEEAIKAAIAALPKNDRKIFLLSRVKGLTYKEIASVMNIAPSTVEKRIRISLSSLREKLKNFHYIVIL